MTLTSSDLLTDPDSVRRALFEAVQAAVVAWWPVAAPAAAGVVVTVLAVRRWARARRSARLWRDARLITITPPPQVEESGGAALWGNLVGLLRPALRRALAGQPHVSFEYRWDHTTARIQMWVPGVIPPGLVERAVEAAWPGAHTTTEPVSPPARTRDHDRVARTVATGGTLRLARPDVLPLATGHDADPLRALFGAATGLADGERADVQVLARPLAGRRIRRARRALRRLRAGQPTRPTAQLLDMITGLLTPASPATARRPSADPERTAELRAALTKAAEPAWEVLIRYAVSHTEPADGAQCHRRGGAGVARMRGRAHALASAFALYSGRNFLTRRPLRRPARAIASRRLDRGDLMSVSELAALAHLPVDDATPGLSRAGARAVAPPPSIPSARPDPANQQPGERTSDPDRGVKVLGDTDAGLRRPVGVSVGDARHHLHIIGATGSGKSTLMINLILGDIAAGRGVLAIDPRGDLVLDLLDRLPATAAGRAVLLDPDDDAAPPPCLNPLDLTLAPGRTTTPATSTAALGGGVTGRVAAADIDTAVDNVVGIFRRIFAGFWGPRTDDVLRAACLTLLRHHRQPRGEGSPDGVFPAGVPTLVDIPRLLDDDTFRRRLTAGIRDQVLAGFWAWYEQLPAGQRAHAVGPVLNKLRAFLLRSFVRESVATGPATLDMTAVLDGGICLVRLPKGVLGEETSHLLGSFVVARAWQAATARARAGTHRIDAGLYIDEAHNYLNLPYPIEDMLAEARGYRLSLVLAHQNLAQLPRELREGISANARNKVFFNASPDDARDLEAHTLPTLARHDLSHLGAFQAAARLLTGSEQTAAFTLRTRPLPPPIPGRAAQIRRAATAASRAPAAGRAPRRFADSGRPATRPGRPDARIQFHPPPGPHPSPSGPREQGGP